MIELPARLSSVAVNELSQGSGHVEFAAKTSLADTFLASLRELGVTTAFGLIGGAIAPLADALGRSDIRLVHCRHEAGAAFAALEASLVSGRPAVVFCTTGPGLLNALNGLYAARRDGGRVIVVSGITPADLRGRGAFQETGPHNMAQLFEAGELFHCAEALKDAADLPPLLERLCVGLRAPGGFVGHVGVPTSLFSQPVGAAGFPPLPNRAREAPTPAPVKVDRCAHLLLEGRCALWVGFGARHASADVRRLVERLGLTVVSTPRGKGIVSEHSPFFAGVTGFAGHPSVRKRWAMDQPRSVLVLGTRLGEFSSGWDDSLVPPDGFVHVDLDPSAFGAAFPRARTHGIEAEIGAFVGALLSRIPNRACPADPMRAVSQDRSPARSEAGPVHPRALMDAVQRVVLDKSDAIVLAEAGNAFAWATHRLAFDRPGRYRMSASWGSMGHAVSGVLGAAIEHDDKAVALAGDGAMLMHNELHTAVCYGVPAVWIILNDARYGMIEHGMRGSGYAPVGTAMPQVDFAGMARAVGAVGLTARDESDLEGVLLRAMAERRPTVVDVLVDPRCPPPIGARVEGLRAQGVDAPSFGEWT